MVPVGIFAFLALASAMFEDEVGKADWRHDSVGIPNAVLSLPRLRLTIIGSDSALAAMSMTNGAIRWRFPITSPVLALQVTDDVDSAVVALSDDAQILVLDPASGDIFTAATPPPPDSPPLPSTATVMPLGFTHSAVISIAFDGVHSPSSPLPPSSTPSALSALSSTLSLLATPFEVRPPIDGSNYKVAFGEPVAAPLPPTTATAVVRSIATAAAASPPPSVKSEWAALVPAFITAAAVVAANPQPSDALLYPLLTQSVSSLSSLNTTSTSFGAASMRTLRRWVARAMPATRCGVVDISDVLTAVDASRLVGERGGGVAGSSVGAKVVGAYVGTLPGSAMRSVGEDEKDDGTCVVNVVVEVEMDNRERQRVVESVVVEGGAVAVPTLRASRIDGVGAAAAVAASGRWAQSSKVSGGGSGKGAVVVGKGAVATFLPGAGGGVSGVEAIKSALFSALSDRDEGVGGRGGRGGRGAAVLEGVTTLYRPAVSSVGGRVGGTIGLVGAADGGRVAVVDVVEVGAPAGLGAATQVKKSITTHAAVVVDATGHVGVVVRRKATGAGDGEGAWSVAWMRDESISVSTSATLARYTPSSTTTHVNAASSSTAAGGTRGGAAAKRTAPSKPGVVLSILRRWVGTATFAVAASQFAVHSIQGAVAGAVGATAAATKYKAKAALALRSESVKTAAALGWLGFEEAEALEAAAAATANATTDSTDGVVTAGDLFGVRVVFVVGTAVGTLRGLDATTGALVWRLRLPSPCSGAVTSLTPLHTSSTSPHDDVVARTATCVSVVSVVSGEVLQVTAVDRDDVVVGSEYTTVEAPASSSDARAGVHSVAAVRAQSLVVTSPKVAKSSVDGSVDVDVSSPVPVKMLFDVNTPRLHDDVAAGALTVWRGGGVSLPGVVVGMRVSSVGGGDSLSGNVAWAWRAPAGAAVIACTTTSTPTSSLVTVERRTPTIVNHQITGHTSAIGVPASGYVVAAYLAAPAVDLAAGAVTTTNSDTEGAGDVKTKGAGKSGGSGKQYAGDELTVVVLDAASGATVEVVTFSHAAAPVRVVGYDTSFVVSFHDVKKARGRAAALHLTDAQTIVPRSVRALIMSRSVAAPAREGASAVPKVEVQGYQFESPIVALAPIRTRHSLVQRNMLVGFSNGRVYMVAARQLDMPNYTYIAPNLTEAVTYNTTVSGLHTVVSAPTLLESTSVVCAVGVDLFCTRVRPTPFDVVPDSFAYTPLLLAVLAVVSLTVAVQVFAARSEANKQWGPSITTLAATVADGVYEGGSRASVHSSQGHASRAAAPPQSGEGRR